MTCDRNNNSTAEIVITRRMAKAGLAVFRERDVYDVFLDDELEDFATRVYEAMASVAHDG